MLTAGGLISKNVLPWEIVSGPIAPGAATTIINIEKNTAPVAALKDAAAFAEYETIMTVLKQVKFNKTRHPETDTGSGDYSSAYKSVSSLCR